MARITIGYKPSGNALGWGGGAWMAGVMRGTTRGGHARPLWVTRLGGRVGRYTGANVTMRYALFAANATTWMPGARLGNTDTFTVSAVQADNASGADYERALLAPVPVAARQPLTLAALGTGAAWAHGQDNTGAIMHEREGLSGGLPTTFGSTNSRPEGNMALWAVAYENEAPTIPAGTLAPAPGSTTIDDTPAVGFDFADANLAHGDYLKSYQVQVWNDAKTAKLYDSGTVTASAGERAARRASRDVTVTLAAARYTVRARVLDHFGTPSAWREWKFTVVGAGSATVTSPTGTTNETQPAIGYTYSHKQGLAADTLIARILDDDTEYRPATTVDLVPDLAAGGSATLSYAATGWTPLTPGRDYRVQVQLVDTDGQPSPWSAAKTFHVNAAPLAGSALEPDAGHVGIAVPELSAAFTDVDDDAASLDVTFFVRAVGAPEWTPLTGLYVTTNGRHYVDPLDAGAIAADAFGDYEWYAQATDPHGLTGPATAVRAFSFVAAPTVTPTAPLGITEASNPAFSWTVSRAQTAYRLQLSDATTGAAIRKGDTGWVTSTAGAHVFDDLLLRNDTTIAARLDVLTAGEIPGAAEWTFEVQYTPPLAVTGVTAEPVMGDFDWPDTPTQVFVAWDESDTEGNEFDSYIVRRRDPATGDVETLALIEPASVTGYVDDTATSGVAYEYQVTQRVWIGLDVLESPPATASASVTLKSSVLSVVLGGVGRAVLPYVDDRRFTPERDRAVRKTWGAKPRVTAGPGDYTIFRAKATALRDPLGRFSAQDLVNAVQELGATWVDEAGQTRPRVLCYRDNRGRRFYCVLTASPETDGLGQYRSEIDIELTEVNFPGVTP